MKPYYEIANLIIDYRARDWCKLPYPDHPGGCPNFNHRLTCPPQAPLIEDYFDLSQPLWLVAIHFDLKDHIARMKAKHADWTERQLRCVLYWQGKVNKTLSDQARQLANSRGCTYTLCPEAMGVQVIKTARVLGIPIKPRPTDCVYKIALIGETKETIANRQVPMWR